MKYLFILLVALTGCSGLSSSSSDEKFYTWVDERGMIHTQKKPNTKTKETELIVSTNKKPEAFKQNNLAVKDSDKIIRKYEIIESDYISSKDVDKKIAGEKLYSWTQDGRQVIAELESSKTIDTSTAKENRKLDFAQQHKEFREGREVLLSMLFSKEIKLENYFNTTKKTNQDYLLIEIDIPDIENLIFNSFTHNNKVALPRINILTSSYLSTTTMTDVFDSYIKETWSSYGRFTGSLIIPMKAKYLLIRPNPTLGVIETADGDFTLIDLGSIQITN